MKSIGIFVVSLFLTSATLSADPVVVADGGCTFYYDKDHRGKTEQCGDGDHYPNRWGWAPRSMRLDRGCKAIFYYTDKFGKNKQYTFNGSERDLYRKMASWKFKSRNYWEYITKVVVICGGNGHANRGGNNHNNGGSWQNDFNRGRFVCFAKNNYGNNFHGYNHGTFRKGDRKFKFYSFKLPKGTRCIFRYKTRSGQSKEHVFTQDVKDLTTHFRQWNLRDWQNGWDYVEWFKFEKYTGGNGQANRGGNNHNNGGGWENDFNRGRFVCFAKNNYGNNFHGYNFGTFHKGDRKFKFYSFKLPKGTRCIFRYKTRSGQSKEHVFTQDVRDLTTYFRQWNLRSWQNGWDYVEWFKFEKYTGGNGQANRGGNNHNNGGGWENDFNRGRFVCFAKNNYGNNFHGYNFGTYRKDDRKFKFYSFKLPKGTRCVFRYKTRSGQFKEHVFTKDVRDLTTHFRTVESAGLEKRLGLCRVV